VTLTIGKVPATITFIGVPYFIAGATQINFVVPDTAPLGLQPVVVTVEEELPARPHPFVSLNSHVGQDASSGRLAIGQCW